MENAIRAYAALEPGWQLQSFEYDPGPLEDHQIEIQVEHCGLCHSDLSMINNDWGTSRYPLVPGHEIVGKVKDIGTRVTSVAVGQTVGLGWHSGYCMMCHQCHRGDHNLCRSAKVTISGRHGGFADRVRADEFSVVALPEGMDPLTAAPLFCAGITVFNPLQQLNIRPTDTVGVIGIGGLGHLAIQFLRAWGCEVWALTSSDAKHSEAIELGAHFSVNSTDRKTLKSLSGKFDFLLSTVNVQMDWNFFLNLLAPKGRLHLLGANTAPVDLNVFGLMSGQKSVSSSPVGSPLDTKAMLAFAARHSVMPVVERFPFAQVNDALGHLASGRAKYRIVLSW